MPRCSYLGSDTNGQSRGGGRRARTGELMEEELELLETQVEEITSGIEEFVPILPDWAMPVLVLRATFSIALAGAALHVPVC